MRQFARKAVRKARNEMRKRVRSRALTPEELLDRGERGADVPSWRKINSGVADRQRHVHRYAYLGLHNLELSALRSTSRPMLDLVASVISGGTRDFQDLVDEAQELNSLDRDISDSPTLRNIGVARLTALHRLLMRPAFAEDEQVVRALLVRTLLAGGAATLATQDPRRAQALAMRLIATQEYTAAQAIVDCWDEPTMIQRQLRCDLMNPYVRPADHQLEQPWLHEINTMFKPYGLEGLSLRDGDDLPLDRLECVTESVYDDGPLVSVIMTCFRPQEDIFTGVRTVLAQSWKNLELLVVDDGSGPEYQDVLDEVEKLDPRVRVIRHDTNRGTYPCRNDALDAATGVYATIHDSDDWMHPLRIELQARHLMAHPSLVANVSSSLRVSENLMFVQDQGLKLRLCEPSIMFDRSKVLATVGYYDSVRKSADGEFRRRIELSFGTSVELLSELPALTLQRTRATSLSTGDFGDNWQHESRLAYRSAYQFWHRTVGRRSPGLMPKNPATRPFPAPSRISGDTSSQPDTLDVVFFADAVVRTAENDSTRALVKRITAARAAGKTVGLCQIWLPHYPPESPPALNVRVQRLINTGEIHHVLLDQAVHARLGVAHTSEVLEFPPTTDIVLTVDQVVAPRPTTADPAPTAAVARGSLALFGMEPTLLDEVDLRSAITQPASHGDSQPVQK